MEGNPFLSLKIQKLPSIISKKVLLRTQRINQASHSWGFLFVGGWVD